MRPTYAVALAVAALLALPTAAQAAAHGGGKPGGSGVTDGYDISYPQCGGSFPSPAAFGIAGVNAGIVYSPNPCLGTGDGPSELVWAESTGHPAFYANTADPGPTISSYWPTGQSTPRLCAASGTDPGPYPYDTDECSYDYGWNAALDSFQNAVAAEQQLHGYDAATATAAAAALPWWLDVETGNSWETLESGYGNTPASQAHDTAALQGAVDALAGERVSQVGFYSSGNQWTRITGGATFAAPNWVAGFHSSRDAVTGCTSANSFTGGPVALTQYHSKGYDADHAC